MSTPTFPKTARKEPAKINIFYCGFMLVSNKNAKLHWKLKRSVSAPKCQYSPAGQSLIPSALPGAISAQFRPKKLNQKAIPAHARIHFSPGTKSALANWTVLALI